MTSSNKRKAFDWTKINYSAEESKVIEIKDVPMAWGTRQEISYIKTIGENIETFESRKLKIKRKSIFLTGYIESCKNRVDWGNIDRIKVLIFAKDMLMRIEAEKR